VTRDELPEDFYNQQFKKWDIGDIIGTSGVLFKTNVGELSVRVDSIKLLTKSLRPLPEKFHGLSDQETRYRQRYVDLIMNENSRNTFKRRSKIVSYIRNFFNDADFIEVETPMLQTIPGGATAKPFETHHNALDMPMYLRISPELYLKRLVVGGMDRVFEINRNFRNEGLSTRHNPEFTMIEFYQAYATYHDLMDLTEKLFRGIAIDICNNNIIHYQGDDFDFSKAFNRISVFDSILEYNPNLNAQDLNEDNAKNTAKKLGIEVKNSWGLGKIQIEIFEATVEEKLMQPTFITQYPTEVSPLARRNDNDPFLTDRFELFIGGREIANGFSELNDAQDQAERFKAQVAEKDAGDDEAMHYDADYIRALEYAMPPTAGEGIGIDRLVMLFTNSASIRDVLLFPHMRAEINQGG
jgi:lysyl-tRNA synthetase class 2